MANPIPMSFFSTGKIMSSETLPGYALYVFYHSNCLIWEVFSVHIWQEIFHLLFVQLLVFHLLLFSSSFSLMIAISLTLPRTPSQVGTCVVTVRRLALSRSGCGWGSRSSALGLHLDRQWGSTQDPVTFLLLKSAQTLLASGESWGLWGFLYFLDCKYFMRRQPRKIWLAFCLIHWCGVGLIHKCAKKINK